MGLPVMVGAIFTGPLGFVLAVTAQLIPVVRRRDPLVRALHSHHAELCVPVGDHGMRYGLDEGGDLVKETVELSSDQRQVIRTREPLLVTRDRRDKNPSPGRTTT
ncbi:MAG TPA: hypothetical protein VIC62_03600 [Nakamurella sp.]